MDIRTFRLAAGVTEDEFLAADKRVQNEFVPNLPGFIRRTTARGADGDWVVVTLWREHEYAEAADQLASTHPVTTAFNALIDPATDATRRYTGLD